MSSPPRAHLLRRMRAAEEEVVVSDEGQGVGHRAEIPKEVSLRSHQQKLWSLTG